MATITPSLSLTPAEGRVDLCVSTRPVARIDHHGGQVRVCMSMLDGDRWIDVSAQPRTVSTLLRREARRRREDPNRWCVGAARVIFDEASRWEVNDLPASDRDDLDGLLASLPFPLARLARRNGAGALPHVPRWAVPALRATSPTMATRTVFGASANRTMARALPQGMVPGDDAPSEGAPDLRPLGLAASLSPFLSADRLAVVLAGSGRWLPPQHWPNGDDLRELRRLWRLVDEPTAAALALDALHLDLGVARLRRALQILEPLAWVAEVALARRVNDLEDQADRTTYHRPDPAPPPRRPRAAAPARIEPAVAAAAPEGLPAVPLRRPPGGRDLRASERFTYPPTIAIVHGYRLGEHRFVLPVDPAELTRWGRRLSNCIGDYAPTVGGGQSVIVGLEERDRLVAALELRNDEVRQFVGIANERPSAPRREVVERMLRDLGLGGR